MRSILWQQVGGSGLDRCELASVPSGFRMAGTALLMADDAPHEIRYTVLTDSDWRTLTVGAHVRGPGGDRRLALQSDGHGNWTVSDSPIIDLYGALDVDLGWTPATNTLAIRRLQLDPGDSASTTVARIDFPAHDIARVAQRYERIDEHTYRYSSGHFTTDLTVDGDGLVTNYPDAWATVSVV